MTTALEHQLAQALEKIAAIRSPSHRYASSEELIEAQRIADEALAAFRAQQQAEQAQGCPACVMCGSPLMSQD